MERAKMVLFCDKCSLQFDKKIVYDIHLSVVHKIKGISDIEEKTIEIKNENTKSNKNQSSLDLIIEGTKSHKCLICDYTTSNKGHLKQHIDSIHKGKKPHACLICDYTTSHKGHLKTSH